MYIHSNNWSPGLLKISINISPKKKKKKHIRQPPTVDQSYK